LQLRKNAAIYAIKSLGAFLISFHNYFGSISYIQIIFWQILNYSNIYFRMKFMILLIKTH